MSDREYKVLIVEDEKIIASALASRLQNQGLSTRIVSDGNQAMDQVRDFLPDLVILDLMLPGKDGIVIAKEIRESDISTSILMLTARDDEADMLTGFSVGADDYVTKPFSPRELMARVNAILRRTDKSSSEQGAKNHQEIIEVGNLYMNSAEVKAVYNGKELYLTPTEFELLSLLASNQKKVFSRSQLLKAVWDWENAHETRTVDSHVKSIRKKSGDPKIIKTHHGYGYSFSG
ncbi:MAG: response regulator transcription factor [Bifidobacteriaceae bacterium]|jgi:DNA-binding response OmpR family regulator|nr:response regulator transcription factor [Bifidobacteriaceae bacterium]